MNTEALAEDIDDDDVDEDQAERTIRLFSLTPAAGAFCLFIGAIAVTMSVCTWENSGAPDAAPVVESRWVVPTVIINTPDGRISRERPLPSLSCNRKHVPGYYRHASVVYFHTLDYTI